MRDLYEAFGIFNLLSPFRPSGSYLLKLDVHEERMVCKVLLELAKAEGWGNMTNVKLNGKTIESIGGEFLQNLPVTGVFEGTYACPEDKTKADARENLAKNTLIGHDSR